MSERYEVQQGPSSWVVRDLQETETIVAFFWPECPDAEARARQLCAELNAAEAKKASEKP